MLKKSLALGLLALAGAAQAAVISRAGSFNRQGYDTFPLVVAADDTYDFRDTGATFDSLISLYDNVGKHLFSGDDSSSGGVHFHLTQDLESGPYTVLITSSRAVSYLLSEQSELRTTDGVNDGGEYYTGGLYDVGGGVFQTRGGTLAGMKAFLDAPSGEALAFQAYGLNISTPMPEPASYAVVALALAGLALTRRRSA